MAGLNILNTNDPGPVMRRVQKMMKGYPQYDPRNIKIFSRRPRVMVVGRNYSSNLCMARSLGEAGFDTEVLRIHSRKPVKDDLADRLIPEAHSRYVKAFYTCVLRGNSRNVLNALVNAADESYRMLLIPTEDVAAYIVDEFYDELSKYYILPDAKGRQGEIIGLMSKTRQKELAEEAGFSVPKGRHVSIINGEFTIPSDMPYPCFLKPDVSRNTSKNRMQVCRDETELRNALLEIAQSRDLELLVEEYIEIAKEKSLLGLSYGGKVTCPGLFEVMDGGHGARRGVAVKGRNIDVAGHEDVMDAAKKMLTATGYNGLFDIDLIEDTHGTRFFVELNLRYGASGYVLTQTGVNLPAMYAECARDGKEIDEEAAASGVRTFVSEKVLLEEVNDGFIGRDEARTIIKEADVCFINNHADPKPYRHFRKLTGI